MPRLKLLKGQLAGSEVGGYPRGGDVFVPCIYCGGPEDEAAPRPVGDPVSGFEWQAVTVRGRPHAKATSRVGAAGAAIRTAAFASKRQSAATSDCPFRDPQAGAEKREDAGGDEPRPHVTVEGDDDGVLAHGAVEVRAFRVSGVTLEIRDDQHDQRSGLRA